MLVSNSLLSAFVSEINCYLKYDCYFVSQSLPVVMISQPNLLLNLEVLNSQSSFPVLFPGAPSFWFVLCSFCLVGSWLAFVCSSLKTVDFYCSSCILLCCIVDGTVFTLHVEFEYTAVQASQEFVPSKFPFLSPF